MAQIFHAPLPSTFCGRKAVANACLMPNPKAQYFKQQFFRIVRHLSFPFYVYTGSLTRMRFKKKGSLFENWAVASGNILMIF